MRALVLLAFAACATKQELPAVRFANAPPASTVNDRRDVARQPQPRDFVRWLFNFDAQLRRPITRALELHRPERALGVNALDEVPSSTWFTNRIGVRDVSPEELAAAPGGVGSPEPHTPWTIVSSKVGGMTVGVIIKDARGEKWLLKFDPRGHPEAETATHVIVAKLLWGFGFNVTEDYVVYVRKQDLVLAHDAMIKDVFGNKRPFTQAELDRRLAAIEIGSDGKIRALASHWLAGKPLGGHSAEGLRSDDPNDRVPHELRRDLRGAYALFAWLDHTDLHEANTLDMWVADSADPKRHYVKHYWIDFGIALGFASVKNTDYRYGYQWFFDFGGIARSLLSLGLADEPWYGRHEPGLRGVGMYETKLYDPGSWKSSSPWYVPIYVADRIDKFWAAKIIMRFTADQIRAVVDSARLSDPKSATWLTEALIERQRATGRYWFERVNPIDDVAVTGDTLCFKDLSIAYAFEPASSTTYAVHIYNRDGKPITTTRVPAVDLGLTCAPVELAPGDDGYTIVGIETIRPHFRGVTYVHLARAPVSNAPRVIGIWRP
jgi:hypothetical protein